jgi:predicted dithiol-disulfide oxidoreductase (DUF899 family)
MVVDRTSWQADVDALRVREKARTHEGDAIEPMAPTYGLLDMTAYGRQETWEDSPAGWPQREINREVFRTNGRPIAQWSRLEAGRSDDLGTGGR